MAPPSASTLRVAAVPMFNIDGVGDSCAFIMEKIEAAARANADVVVFPETATNAYHTKPLEDREAIEAQLPEILRTIGRTGKPWVILGSYTFDADGAHNSSLVIDPEGAVRGVYHKIAEGGARWLMLEINGVPCTTLVCSDMWVPGILQIPQMLGARVCLYPHASGTVTEERRDWSSLYYVRAWENGVFLVMADCSRTDGESFERPGTVPYPYDFDYHQLNQSCIVGPEPQYLARAGRDERDGMLLADLDPQRAKAPMDPDRYTIGKPWAEMLDYYRKNGFIDWVK